MDIIKKSKTLVDKVEEGAQKGIQVIKDTFDNVARHLPFANLAKHANDTFTIEVDLPGVKKEDIELKIEGDHLNVTAQRRYKNETKEEDYYLCESSFGMISRSFALSDAIDKDKVEAKYEDGRLIITLQKSEAKKAKSIAVS